MTKQGGLYLVAVFPLLSWLMAIKDDPELRAKIWRNLGLYIGLFILLVSPFYLYKALAFSNHQDVSVIPQIMDQLYGTSGPGNPLKTVFETFIFLGKKTYGIFPLFFLLLPFAWGYKKYRHIIGWIIVPFFFIWMFFAGYDTRNLSLILPLLSIGACVGIEWIITKKRTWVESILSHINIFLVFAIAIAFLVITGGITSQKIIEGHKAEYRQLYDSELSLRISDYFENTPDAGKIYSNSPFLFFLPATKDRMYSPNGGYSHNDDFKNYFEEIKRPDVTYIFAMYYTDKKIMDDIEAKIAAREYTLIFKLRGYILVKKNT